MDGRDLRLKQLDARRRRDTATATAAVARGASDSGGRGVAGLLARATSARGAATPPPRGGKMLADNATFNPDYHKQWARCRWIKVANLDGRLTERDVATVFSQFGEVTDVRHLRQRKTGDFTTGRSFVQYADPRSCVLALDNMHATALLVRAEGSEGRPFAQGSASLGDQRCDDRGAPPRVEDKSVVPSGVVYCDHCDEVDVPALVDGVVPFPVWLASQLAPGAAAVATAPQPAVVDAGPGKRPRGA